MKTKKFKDFVANMEVGLDLVKNENNTQTIDLTKYSEINNSTAARSEHKSPDKNAIAVSLHSFFRAG